MHVLRSRLLPALAILLASTHAAYAAPQRPPIDITAYVIHADLDPASGALSATATVTFTSLEDITTASFELNRSLQVASVYIDKKQPLNASRNAADNTVQVILPQPMAKNLQATITFEYKGVLQGTTNSPIEGVRTAAISDPISVLLYPGRWFPLAGYLTDRFIAEMHITVPAGEIVIGSGSLGSPKPQPGGRHQYDFNWTKPGFPGTIIAGKFEPAVSPAGTSIHVYGTADRLKDKARNFTDYARTGERQLDFMTSIFGQTESGRINVVELPEDSVSAFWAPQMAAINGARIGLSNSARLLANTIARQWWSSEVSPATLNDTWITNGMSRYTELMYVEDSAGQAAFQTAINDVAAGALAYDTQPLSSVGRLDTFSPEFQSMTLEKGAMVFHMLRWELGDDAFHALLKSLLTQFSDRGIRQQDVQATAETLSANAKADTGTEPKLTAFFSQWLDSNGAPQYTNKYSVYRLGKNQGFRTIGAISEDLDLFSMPVLLRIETDGKTVTQRLQVAGTNSTYSVETFGRPRRITIDPDNWILKNTPELAVRVAILRGQQRMAEGDSIAAIAEYRKALDLNRNSSLASYRIAEVLFTQKSYQNAADSFRDALRGDDDPRWTEVWSHIGLGKIFDLTGQRDRAVNEYRLALQTNDNTQGALNEARKYLAQPFKHENDS
ncbi:MAG TPA: M1 family aminopeptidase [Acidobacteriaceae bacterium]